jgi:di/tricarboxylate transporter
MGTVVRWAVALAGAIVAVLFWTGHLAAELDAPARGSLGVAALAVGLWGSELVALPVTAVLAMVLLWITGAAPRGEDAFAGLASPVLLFLLGTAAIGIAGEHTGLADRLAAWLLARCGGSGRRLLLELLLSLPLQAFLVPSAISRNAVLVPVYDRVLDRLGRPRRLGMAVMLTLGVLGPYASSALLSGGTSPVATAHALGGFTWLSWFVAVAPPYYVLLLVCGVIVWLFCRPEASANGEAGARSGTGPACANGDPDGAARQPVSPVVPARHRVAAANDGDEKGEGPPPYRSQLSAAEQRLAMVSLGTSLLWIMDRLTGWPPAIPALLAMIVLLAPRVGVMSWAAFAPRAPWSTCFVLAGATSLALALSRTGAAAWMARGLFGWAPSPSHPAAAALAIFVVAAVMTLAIPNRAAAITLAIPLATAYAATSALPAAAAGLIVMIAVDAETIYPAQTAANLMAYQQGYFSAGQLARFNALTLLAAALVTIFVALPWWSLIGLP